MKTKQLRICITFLLMTIVLPIAAQKTIKIRNAVGRWQVSDNVTLKEAEERARMEAKKEALRKAGVMEKVWSVFGQISTESGTEFQEAYSQMNVLAIGGMINVTREKVEEVWNVDSRSLYKVVTIDAEVQKEEIADKTYGLEVKGISTLYKAGDTFTCKIKVRGTDSYLKFFWFDSTGGSLLYPNNYEGDNLLKAEQEYSIPFSNMIDYRMEKRNGKDSETINMMLVATKENIPYTDDVTYEKVLKWVYAIPNNQRCATYELVMIK